MTSFLQSLGLGTQAWDSPGGLVVENLPASAGVTGLIYDLGSSHMPCRNRAPGATNTEPVLYSPWATISEPQELQLLKPVCLQPMLCNKGNHCNKKPVRCKEEEPTHPPTPSHNWSLHTTMKTHQIQKQISPSLKKQKQTNKQTKKNSSSETKKL